MVGRRVVGIDDDLGWEPFDIPGGSMPVRLVTVRAEAATRARTVLVAFPEGWRRDEAGSYSCAEEIVVIDGAFEMNGALFDAGSWAYVPAGTGRRATIARPSALVLARFDGSPRWSAHTGEEMPIPVRALAVETRGGVNPFGARRASLLRRGPESVSWIADVPEAGGLAGTYTEVLDLGLRTWHWIPAGSAYPELEGPCFCRTFASDDGGGEA